MGYVAEIANPDDVFEGLSEGSSILVLTGAGVSVGSGIPDFQTMNENWDYEEDRFSVMSRPFWKQEPVRFWGIYKELFAGKIEAEPNGAHHWLASLEERFQVQIVTQNVDGLHQASGSSHVYEFHGNMANVECMTDGCGFRGLFKSS